MRLAVTCALGVLLAGGALWRGQSTPLSAQARTPAGVAHTGKAFRFNKVRDGIYHAIGTGAMTVVGNSAVIVTDEGTVVVDDHVSPAAAWVLRDEIRELTDKPIRYVINTHFHYDHSHGNQVFGPGVDIIGHEFTRQMIEGGKAASMPLYRNYVAGLPAAIDALRARAAAESDAAAREKLQAQLSAAENNLAAQKEFRPVPPNLTLKTEMTLHLGGREIQIRFLGRGHTGGDVVVFLPRERVVITGDFLTAALSNMSDSYPEDWVTALDALKRLDFQVVLPGHGEAFTDRAKIDYFQAYMRDVWAGMRTLKMQGVSVADAARRVDLTKHREHFPGITGPGIPLIGAERIYALLDGTVR